MKATLPIPPKVIELAHSGIMGKTGSGKSSLARVCAEYLHSIGKRVVIIDPKGDWYGIKSDATGKGPGLPFILFGDYKVDGVSDVPLTPESGKAVAQLICSGNRPAVIGLGGWMPKALTRFFTDFISTVFTAKSGEIYIIIDECHNFAPKGALTDPEATLMLHWAKRIMTEGRGLGIVALIASQRPQKVHNDVLSSCETLFAMRVLHKSDREAIKDWVDGCGDDTKGKEVISSLAQMKRGQAYVWSPEVGFGPERVQFPMFQTFDSFAPPQLQPKIKQSSWANVDLDAVREQLAQVIKEKKENDPRLLKQRIRELEERTPVPDRRDAVALDTLLRERNRLADENKELRRSLDSYKAVRKFWVEIANEAMSGVTAVKTRLDNAVLEEPKIHHLVSGQPGGTERAPEVRSHRQVAVAEPRRVKESQVVSERAQAGSPDPAHSLSKMARAILTALAQHAHMGGLTKGNILTVTDYRSSGPVSSTFAELSRNGWVTASGNKLAITPEGLEVLGPYDALPTGAALREYILTSQKTTTMEKAFMGVLFDNYPNPISKGEILKATNYASSGPVSSAFARIVRIGWAKATGSSLLCAHENLFNS